MKLLEQKVLPSVSSSDMRCVDRVLMSPTWCSTSCLQSNLVWLEKHPTDQHFTQNDKPGDDGVESQNRGFKKSLEICCSLWCNMLMLQKYTLDFLSFKPFRLPIADSACFGLSLFTCSPVNYPAIFIQLQDSAPEVFGVCLFCFGFRIRYCVLLCP